MALPGGSAYGFSRDVAGGYFLVTERTFQRMTKPELEKIAFELNRHLREVRGTQPDLEDIPAIQTRNRRIQRINSALTILRSYRAKRKI
jgi:hypothetical protein